MKNTKKKGFTIVELVIVIAVIGILSAILIPTFSNLVANSKEAALQENLRNAYVAYSAEAAEKAGDYLAQENVVFSNDNGTTYYVYLTTGEKPGYKKVNTGTPGSALTYGDPATPYGTFNGYTAYAKGTASYTAA